VDPSHVSATPPSTASSQATPARAPITVLHVRIVTGTGGGPEKTILESPRHLSGTRYRALAAYLHSPGDPGIGVLAARAAEKQCPFVALPDSRMIDTRALKALRELCERENVRIWHAHDYKSNLYGLFLRKKLGLRLVTTVHGWVKHTARTPLYYAVDRWCLRRYEQVVAVSQDLVEASRKAGVRDERLVQVDNAIDAAEFARRWPAGASPMRIASPERLVIGAVGRLSPEKGFEILIEAVEKLITRGLDVELWIAGEGEEKERLEQRMRASPHSPRLRLLGWEPDARALFEAFDVFALSSLREGLPNVLLEAMAMEVPVVATRCGGLETFGRDGEDMLLVPAGSAEALEHGLERLVRDPALRARLSRAARARIERELGFARRMEKIVAVYDRLGL
jgi:glycosyltransferase involved in cell wall biosynthesis